MGSARKNNSKPQRKSVYTTGEVARICGISQQTVIRCFDNGKLKGFRVPGSRFRRIPHDSLVEFMKQHGIPLDKLLGSLVRVLIVDDDQFIVDMLTELLAGDGRFDLRTGTSGFDAGMIAREFRPDVILLDFKLPDVNGTLVCKTVRSDKELSETKIIMISGVAAPEEIEELMSAGADEFIKKPFDVDMVIARITELSGV